MLSRNARFFNFFLKYIIKPLQAYMPITPGVMIFIRRLCEAWSRLVFKYPSHVSTQVVSARGVPGEWVLSGDDINQEQVILYLHGGGYFFGSPRTHRPLTWRLSEKTKTRVLIIDYRLVPEHTVDDCCDDAVNAYHWLLDEGYQPEDVVIGGDSAGGGLTLLTLLALKNREIPLPRAAFCLSPFADMSRTSPTLISNARKSHMFHPNAMKKLEAYLSAGRDPYDTAISPAFGDYKGIPPLLIMVSDAELLLNDARLTARNAEEAGVEVELKIWHNLPHVFTLFADILPEGKQGIEEIAFFVNNRLVSV